MGRQRMAALVLSENERAELRALAARRKTAQALAMRARIVLDCASGLQNKEVAARFLGNRSSPFHHDEMFLGQHHLVHVKHGLGCLELNALEWRRI